MSDLQQLTDRLGELLSRSVAIDDPTMRLLTYSPHHGVVDQQRLNSILKRQADPESTAWAYRHGIQRATGPIRVPPNPGTGMLSRICIPIRFQGSHLGYLWILDRHESMCPDDIMAAEDAATAAAQVLYRERLTRDLERSRERELLRDLLDDRDRVREHAVRAITEEALVATGGPVQVLVLDTSEPGAHTGRDTMAEFAIANVRQMVPAKHSLHLVRPDHAILLVALDRPVAVDGLAHRLRTEYSAQFHTRPTEVRVAVGGEASGLAEAHRSYGQAMLAARVGRLLTLDPVISWAELGIYRLLAELPFDRITTEALHPALTALVDADPSGDLLATLETFLDLAGDVKASADRLFVHRTTLYHRLGRIEEIGGVSLRRGSDRLALHLGLKLGHLAGLFAVNVRPP